MHGFKGKAFQNRRNPSVASKATNQVIPTTPHVLLASATHSQPQILAAQNIRARAENPHAELLVGRANPVNPFH
jgi:hypothetical protein